MNNLHRELAPISAAAWADLEAEARRTFERHVAARRIVDVPDPGGVQLAAVNTGHLDPIDPPAEGVIATSAAPSRSSSCGCRSRSTGSRSTTSRAGPPADRDRAGGAPRLGALGNRVRGALEAGRQASLAQLQDEALVRRLREERVELLRRGGPCRLAACTRSCWSSGRCARSSTLSASRCSRVRRSRPTSTTSRIAPDHSARHQVCACL